MKPEPSQSEVWSLIAGLLGHYGKIGLLVDDAIDARIRISRELYGAEGLPEWWIQARTIECGFLALQAFLSFFPSQEGPPRWGIVVIDRFLPVKDHAAKTRPVAWDAPRLDTSPEDKEICNNMELAVRQVLTLAKERNSHCFCKVITSYPHSSLEYSTEAAQESPIPWQTRSIEVLYQFRRNLAHTPLLTYGPDRNALYFRETAVPPNIERPELEEAKWKAQYWRESLLGLAEALARPRPDRPVILFTGAGNSLAEGIYGPGMPTTSSLLEETCQTVAENITDREDLGDEVKGYWHRFKWKRKRPGEPKSFSQDVAPIDFLIKYLAADKTHRAADLECRLETIFSKKLNTNSTVKGGADRFYDCFRDILQRSDYGFPYHHWLLAQMPWTRIITTNFDGFHERAAMAAVTTFDSKFENRLHCLRLANVFPISAVERHGASLTQQQVTELYTTCLLFKPYGSLLSPVELAISAEGIDKFKTHLDRALDVVKKARQGWLVVVGHAMKDAHIEKVLNELDGPNHKLQRRFELLWVDPDSYNRCIHPISRGDQTIGFAWDRLIDGKRTRRGTEVAEAFAARYSGPLPATALEFSYDLSVEYREALKRLGPRGGA